MTIMDRTMTPAAKPSATANSIAAAEALAREAGDALLGLQQPDGHIVFELEADTTIPSEYIFLNHFLGRLEPELEAQLAEYIRAEQSDRHGGWPLFYDGDFNISASVKAYYALKLVGDDADAPHMARARKAILDYGGAETANVFTRYALALFQQIPWSGVPAMPVELMLMPRWFPINVWKFSYWSRTVIAPLLILAAHKARAKNPRASAVASCSRWRRKNASAGTPTRRASCGARFSLPSTRCCNRQSAISSRACRRARRRSAGRSTSSARASTARMGSAPSSRP